MTRLEAHTEAQRRLGCSDEEIQQRNQFVTAVLPRDWMEGDIPHGEEEAVIQRFMEGLRSTMNLSREQILELVQQLSERMKTLVKEANEARNQRN